MCITEKNHTSSVLEFKFKLIKFDNKIYILHCSSRILSVQLLCTAMATATVLSISTALDTHLRKKKMCEVNT